MKKKFFTSGIGLIAITLMVAFAFLLVTPGSEPRDIRMIASTTSLGDAGKLDKTMNQAVEVELRTDNIQVIASTVPTRYEASATMMNQEITIKIRKIDAATSVYVTGALAGYNQNTLKRSLACTAYKDAINKANTAIERPSMSVVLSNLPGQRNFPLKIC